MRARMQGIVDELAAPPKGQDAADVEETRAFLAWARRRPLHLPRLPRVRAGRRDGEDQLRIVPAPGWACCASRSWAACRRASRSCRRPSGARARAAAARPHQGQLALHRPPPGLPRLRRGQALRRGGPVAGERRFLGLYTSAAYHAESRARSRCCAARSARVLERAGFPPTSHDGQEPACRSSRPTRATSCSRSTTRALRDRARHPAPEERRRTRLFLRRDLYGRFVSCLVYLPRDRYNTDVRVRIAGDPQAAARRRPAPTTPCSSPTSVLARVHFARAHLARDEPRRRRAGDRGGARAGDARAGTTTCATRWSTRSARSGPSRAAAALRRAFPAAYREDVSRAHGGARLAASRRWPRRRALAVEPLPAGGGRRARRCASSSTASARRLALRRAADAREHGRWRSSTSGPYEIGRGGRQRCSSTTSGCSAPTHSLDVEAIKARSEEAFAARGAGEIENDGFNRLVLAAGLALATRSWCCAPTRKYLRQAGSPSARPTSSRRSPRTRRSSRLLVGAVPRALRPGARRRRARRASSSCSDEIEAALDEVASLDEDRILRRFLDSIRATLRTNYYQCDGADGSRKPYLSLQARLRARSRTCRCRGRCSRSASTRPRVEGVHLRGGKVARGGLRWSDRREDFRTEVLGLMKAQMVKNAVIVPVGSKGGFVLKAAPPAADREAYLDGGRRLLPALPPRRCSTSPTTSWTARSCRRATSCATTATTRTSWSRPTRARRRSPTIANGSPPSTASGWATPSPPAARPATTTRRWASPPAARGNAVKRHFRELGIDTPEPRTSPSSASATCPATCSATACCCRAHIRLRGGVRPPAHLPRPRSRPGAALRRARAAVRAAALVLGRLRPDAHLRGRRRVPALGQVDPADRRRCARCSASTRDEPHARRPDPGDPAAPVDLLWIGGIGTYVKASHRDARRRRRPRQRRDPRRRRASCAARWWARAATSASPSRPRRVRARRGGRINTDAIDNSAGVDCSDHEVNIKILLDRVVARGDLTREAAQRAARRR